MRYRVGSKLCPSNTYYFSLEGFLPPLGAGVSEDFYRQVQLAFGASGLVLPSNR